MVDLRGKRVLVVGLGKSGTAAIEALLSLGASCAVQDAKSVEKLEPKLLEMLEKNNIAHYLGIEPGPSEQFDMLVLSPGVPPALRFIQNAKQNGSGIIGELELAFRMSKGKFIAITGTNGKTTTTTLVGEIFKNAGKDAYVAGNIGLPVTSVVRETKDDSWIITETSSFQLETIKNFKPVISAFLNISPDHLDRYKNMQNYIGAKAKIFENQNENDYFIVNYDEKEIYELSSKCKAKVIPFSRVTALEDVGVFIKEDKITIGNEDGELIEVCAAGDLLIPGAHNLENALAATAIAYFAGISVPVIAETLSTFAGVEHRLEFCRELEGVRFINDSKGTNPDASIKAVEAIKGPIILIAGGADKNLKFEAFIEAFGDKVKHMMLLGATAENIKETAERKGFNKSIILKNMEECVNAAFESAEPGYTVLLSPACASLDMYSCFEERGVHFKNCVMKLGS